MDHGFRLGGTLQRVDCRIKTFVNITEIRSSSEMTKLMNVSQPIAAIYTHQSTEIPVKVWPIGHKELLVEFESGKLGTAIVASGFGWDVK